MSIAWYDFIGGIGVVLVLATYGLLQAGRMAADDLAYSVANLVGAILIGISLLYAFNLASFIIEVFWATASAYGIWRALRRRQVARAR